MYNYIKGSSQTLSQTLFILFLLSILILSSDASPELYKYLSNALSEASAISVGSIAWSIFTVFSHDLFLCLSSASLPPLLYLHDTWRKDSRQQISVSIHNISKNTLSRIIISQLRIRQITSYGTRHMRHIPRIIPFSSYRQCGIFADSTAIPETQTSFSKSNLFLRFQKQSFSPTILLK